MRWRAFYSLCTVLGAGAYFITLIFAHATGHFALLLIVIALATVIVIPLSFLNRALLNWRLMRGRDIEEEERYETEGGFLTLHTNATREELLTRHNPDPESLKDLDIFD